MANTYTLLETITVGAAGASSVTFNSIPQTGYTDLIVKVSGRIDYAAIGDYFKIQFNGVTTDYTDRFLYGNGSAAASASGSLAESFVVGASATASTFGNAEIYIPNYTSANYKSFSVDAVNENNATSSLVGFFANLWSNTAAITSVTLTPEGSGSSNFVEHSTFSLYGVSALGVTPTKAPKATGGSIIQTDGTYWYHAFLSSGTFTPATGLSCEVLVVGGGGGGGSNHGGGAGAGGYRTTTGLSLSSATTVTVGAGGSRGPGTQGGSSVFSSITSAGGGYGANNVATGVEPGGTGGSGGGSRGASGGAAGNTPSTSPSQGNNGGNGDGTGTGGGGGAGAVGANTVSSSLSGAGGAGLNTLSSWLSTTGLGVSGYVAGGGGGGNPTTGGAGGSGGGGQGGSGPGVNGTDAVANTGGGGGGGGSSSAIGGNGGSGVVIIRYLAA
jgi:hypothetical protein